MLRFALRRILTLLPLLLIVSVAVFLVLRLGQGDPALDYLRLAQIPPSEAALAQARMELGLDRPIPVQYLHWLGGAVRLDFGTSWVTRRPVLDELLHYLPATLELAGAALFLVIVVGIPLGILAALTKDRWPDQLTRLFAFVGASIPNFWLAFLLVLLFSVQLGWLPPMGRGGLEHLVLPATATALMSTAINLRLMRASVLAQLGERHLLFARARGLPERAVIGRHVVRNALIPPVTAIGLHVGELIGGAMIVEIVFGWPGVGRYALQAITSRDFPALQGFILLMTTVFVLCNLLVDLAYAWLDPRIRFGASTS
ncbi:nickel ABC transporter permease subunit NikB [Geminicoccus harenae]|uniref:nickel ABC transporter permease subunit NikB n=1 Tax=Geminicoccus harenae TaxID=2498453 RepID=UPI00168A595D|nr:nickel ABC transporter permease subunit NikB [Geminicoccus harenae]